MVYDDALRELFFWKYRGVATNFHGLLFELICKADEVNMQRIAMGFPNEVQAYMNWQNSDDEERFWNENGYNR